jgi:thioredoxin:protein disulfide reductase
MPMPINPSYFSAGALRVTPEAEFFDKYSNKTRLGIYESGFVHVIVEAPPQRSVTDQVVTFELRYQICSDSVCFLPKTKTIEIRTVDQLTNTGSIIAAPVTTGFSLFQSFDQLLQSNLILAFISVFLAGILTSFTPCIFPMLPITVSVLGYNAEKNSRLQNLSRALAYVLGIAITYSSLGVLAALTGSIFGSMLANKYVLGGLVLLFFTMALSMWDVFQMQVPAFIRNRLGAGRAKAGLGGVFLMGLAAGIVASPCVGPVLVSILTYVSTTKSVLLGFSLLFTFALGLGMLFIAIGLFSSTLRLLPKSGAWMDSIKFVLGAGMWAAALYYCQFLLPQQWWMSVVALSFIALAIWKGAFKFQGKKYMRQSFLLALFIFSSAVLVVSVFKPEYMTTRVARQVVGAEAENTAKPSGNWAVYSEKVLKEAADDKRPVMIDFFAEWCGACHELDEKTFSTDEFKQLSSEFRLVKFDATEDNSAVKEVLNKYGIKGLPTVIFIGRDGQVIKNLTFTQFLTIDELKPKMQEALK